MAHTTAAAFAAVTGVSLRTSGDYFALVCDPATPPALTALALLRPLAEESTTATSRCAPEVVVTRRSGAPKRSTQSCPGDRGVLASRDQHADAGPLVPASAADWSLWARPSGGGPVENGERYQEPLWLSDLELLRGEAALHL